MEIMSDEKKVEKYIKDGKVAILISGGFGAGWSTWNSDKREYLLFDKELVELVLKGDRKGAAQKAEEHFGEDYVCTLGAEDLEVEWLDEGSQFEVNEYDGSESLHIIGSRQYNTA